MRIYRVEHKFDNLGPFRNNYFVRMFEVETNDSQYHPTPNQEGLSHVIDRGFMFGCTDLDELLRWFKPFLQYLHDEEYALRIFESHNYYVGNTGKQVAFDRNCYSTQLIEEISLQTLIR